MNITVTFNSFAEIDEFVREFRLRTDVCEVKPVVKVEEVNVELPNEIKMEEVKAEDKTVVNAVSEPKYISIREAAEKYHTSHQLIRYYINKKKIPTKQFKNCVMVEEKKIDKYMKKSNTGKTSTGRLPKSKTGNNTLPTDFAMWQREQFNKIDTKGMDRGKVCSQIFDHLTKTYGIVWTQERKKFLEKFGYYAKSTLRLCYFMQYEEEHKANEHYEKLFENKLDELVA